MITQSEFENISIEIADSSEAERNKTYDRIRRFATEHLDQFKQFLSDFPLDKDSALFEVYEALGESGDQFNQLISNEVKRLLDASSNAKTRTFPSLALGGFYTANDSQTKRKIQDEVLKYYDSDFANTRRCVISLIVGSNLFNEDKNNATTSLRNKVEELTNDSDWRVRVLAHEYLTQNLGVIDMIRTKLFDPYSW